MTNTGVICGSHSLPARLLFRVDPAPLESPRGYLCRVAHAHGYKGPSWLTDLAGLSPHGLEREGRAAQLAYTLRLETQEWLQMCYERLRGEGRYARRSFSGQAIDAFQLNYRWPRVCPRCLREHSLWWAMWDLALVTACPMHRCLLINRCPACEKKLTWDRPAVHQCACGMDLRMAEPQTAGDHLMALNAAIYRAGGFQQEACEILLKHASFPAGLNDLRLDGLLRVIRFVGSIQQDGRLRTRQIRFSAANLGVATELGIAASATLADWPRAFCSMLRLMLPAVAENVVHPTFQDLFGNFYRHLYLVLPRKVFGFLHDAFEKFVIEDWKGLVRRNRSFLTATHRKTLWIPALRAGKLAHISRLTVVALVRSSSLDGMFIERGRIGTQCWVNRESLQRWIANRQAEFGRYMSRPQAVRALGLDHATVLSVAQAGLIRHLEGSQHNFPSGLYLDREDVTKLKNAFAKYAVPLAPYSKPGETIALRHALRLRLGCHGVPTIIRAVVDGVLAPVGRAQQFPGIAGYLFIANELRKFRPMPEAEAVPEGFLNYTEAASLLKTRRSVIPRLVAQGVLGGPAGYPSRSSKLVHARDVRRFAEQYVDASFLAKRCGTNAFWVSSYLKTSALPKLMVPVPGRGLKVFLPRATAASVRIPPPKHPRQTRPALPDRGQQDVGLCH
jgi:hypothetical protein